MIMQGTTTTPSFWPVGIFYFELMIIMATILVDNRFEIDFLVNQDFSKFRFVFADNLILSRLIKPFKLIIQTI